MVCRRRSVVAAEGGSQRRRTGCVTASSVDDRRRQVYQGGSTPDRHSQYRRRVLLHPPCHGTVVGPLLVVQTTINCSLWTTLYTTKTHHSLSLLPPLSQLRLRLAIPKVHYCSQGEHRETNTNPNLICRPYTDPRPDPRLTLIDPRAKYKLIRSETVMDLWNSRRLRHLLSYIDVNV